jgi:MinD-like ATPase involved in chromosome partitioning or flagellar assembly
VRAEQPGQRDAGAAMKTVIAVFSTRAGQTSTYWATSLAWTLAETRSVLLVDCDMEGGTIADLLYLRLDDRGLANCFGDRPASSSELEAQAIQVPERAGLRVVPGLRTAYGYEVTECLRKLGPALRTQPSDAVVVDLGHPLSHPGLRSPRAAAEAIAAAFHRVFIVVRDDPALLARSIDVLRSARLAHGEIIVCQQRSRTHQRLLAETLGRELPELRLRNSWTWDERKAARMADTGRPMQLAGIEAELSL